MRTTPPAAIPTLTGSVSGPLSNQSGLTEAVGDAAVALTMSSLKMSPSSPIISPGSGFCSQPASRAAISVNPTVSPACGSFL